MPLLGVVLAVIAGHSIGGVLAALTIPQWIEIGSLVAKLLVKAEPAVVATPPSRRWRSHVAVYLGRESQFFVVVGVYCFA